MMSRLQTSAEITVKARFSLALAVTRTLMSKREYMLARNAGEPSDATLKTSRSHIASSLKMKTGDHFVEVNKKRPQEYKMNKNDFLKALSEAYDREEKDESRLDQIDSFSKAVSSLEMSRITPAPLAKMRSASVEVAKIAMIIATSKVPTVMITKNREIIITERSDEHDNSEFVIVCDATEDVKSCLRELVEEENGKMYLKREKLEAPAAERAMSEVEIYTAADFLELEIENALKARNYNDKLKKGYYEMTDEEIIENFKESENETERDLALRLAASREIATVMSEVISKFHNTLGVDLQQVKRVMDKAGCGDRRINEIKEWKKNNDWLKPLPFYEE